MLRELKGWTQAELAGRSGISATNFSLLENEKVTIGKKLVEQLAKAFDIHPAILSCFLNMRLKKSKRWPNKRQSSGQLIARTDFSRHA